MFKTLILFSAGILLIINVSCKSTSMIGSGSVDSLVSVIDKYELPDTVAQSMIDYFSACKDSTCKDPVKQIDEFGIFGKIRQAYTNIESLELIPARFRNQKDADTYCSTRNFPPGSDSCQVIKYSIELVKIKFKTKHPSHKKTKYYSFRKICPPPPHCT